MSNFENIIPNSILFNKTNAIRKVQKCPLDGEDIDYKNLELIKRFISEKGRILPRRLTGVSAINQRRLKVAIKRARVLALIQFTQR